MTSTTHIESVSTDRLDEIMGAIRFFKKIAMLAEESANGIFGNYSPEFKTKWQKRARIRMRAAGRLSQLLAKECDKIKEAQ